MNFQQLEYITAVDRYRHFQKAADSCFVTQPTLSMMIQKLEDELKVQVFDRKTSPVQPTKEGVEIIRRARVILAEVSGLKTFAGDLREEISGQIHIGIIPTLAPYLLPMFLKPFMRKNAGLEVFVREMMTEDLMLKLHRGEMDMAILATPLHDDRLNEYPVFHEEFLAYASSDEKLPGKKYLLPRQIDISHLWLLEEGHCMRNQIFNLCELKKAQPENNLFHYEAGSIESLVNLVDHYHGITIIPRLAAESLKSVQKKKLREFARPKPVREISIVTARNYPRLKIVEKLKQAIQHNLPAGIAIEGKSATIDTERFSEE